MSKPWKISEAASIALHGMTLLAARPNETLSTKEIAAILQVSEAHLSKVLQRLTKANLVKAIRGPKGGFLLSRTGDVITLREVYEAIDGPFTPTNCLLSSPICNGENCLLGGLLADVDRQVADYLNRTKLSDLTRVFTDNKQGD